jgi:trehalose-6-phosphate synthase
MGQFSPDLLHGRVDIHRDATVALGGPILARIVVVSNRVSVPSGDGAKRAGGLEVALRPALERNGGVWFGWSGKAVPGADVKMHTVCHKNVTYVVTDLSEEDYQEYYNGFANRVLWPILHFRLDLAEFARRDLTGYMRVNDHFAAELEKIIEPDDLIWVHDYHLIPIADALRRRGHANRIGFFLHVPMPPPEVLASLPNHEQLIPLLLQYDVVGFQTDGDSGNFVRYLIAENQDSHREMRVFETSGHQISFTSNGRQTRVGSFPVGIEPRAFQVLARRNVRSALVKDLVTSLGGRTLIAAQDPEDPGVLILSRFAGAAVDAKRALLVNPYDAESVAGAIAQALAMPLDERRERHAALLHGIIENDVNKWQKDFLDALRNEDLTATETRSAMQMSTPDRRRTERRRIVPGTLPQRRA